MSWYDQFKSITLKTIIINLAPELLEKFRKEDFESEIEDICNVDYVNQIKNAIQSLNNDAFVKNNWHAPTVCCFTLLLFITFVFYHMAFLL